MRRCLIIASVLLAPAPASASAASLGDPVRLPIGESTIYATASGRGHGRALLTTDGVRFQDGRGRWHSIATGASVTRIALLDHGNGMVA